MKKKLLFAILAISLLASCSKESPENLSQDSDVSTLSKKPLKSPPIQSSDFDWENVSTYCGLSMPWNTGTISFIPQEWKHEHKRIDGWELLYNTLDRTEPNVIQMFALYNKYLGIMRVFYIYRGNTESSQQFAMAIRINGQTTLLNAENTDYNTAPITNPVVVKSQPIAFNNISSSGGFVPNAWYGVELQMEYQDVSLFNNQNLNLEIFPYRSLIQDVKLDSKTTGTITGTIETKPVSSGSGSLIGSLSMVFGGKKGEASTTKQAGVDEISKKLEDAQKNTSNPRFINELWKKIKNETPGFAQGKIVENVNSIVSMGLNWASNPVMNFAKSAFGISSGNGPVPTISDVKLKVDTKTITSGTITSQLPLGTATFSLPTTQYTNGGFGFPTSKMTNYGLGVWTLSEMPMVNVDYTEIIYTKKGNPMIEPRESQIFFDVKNSNNVNILFNPKVLEDCSVINKSIKYAYKLDNLSETAESIKKIGIPFKYDNGAEYYELNYGSAFVYPFYNPSLAYNVDVVAHISIVLKNKTTGKIFNIIKTIDIPNSVKKNVKYKELGSSVEPGDPILK